MRIFLLSLLLLLVQVANAKNAQFTYLRSVSVEELNLILSRERDEFMKEASPPSGYKVPAVSRASNDVDLYTVDYDSEVPEQGRRPVRTTGLLALPRNLEKAGMPLISYQHGTVFGKYEVPSYAFQKTNPGEIPHYQGSYETRYMVALYAGNGFALMAADYFGMGGDARNDEAYFVKASTQQANLDLYRDVRAFLKARDAEPSRLFLGGWSLGGLNTTGFLQKLESEDVKVDAVFTASAPSDPFAALSGLMYFPRPDLDAVWLNTIVALSVFSYESYYTKPGLAQSVLNPLYYADLLSIYARSYGSTQNLIEIFHKFGRQPLINYFKNEYRNPSFFAKSEYGRLLRENETYRQLFKAPVRMYYGSMDEAVKESIGILAHNHQNALMGNPDNEGSNRIQAQRVPNANHRATFLTAAPEAMAWFQSLK